MRIFKVIDSDTHWVIAEDESDAVDVVCEAHDLDKDDVSATVTEIPEEEARAILFYDDDGVTKIGTLWSEFEKDPRRSYLSGPE